MESGDSNIMRFSSSIAGSGDTFFHPLPSSPSSIPLRLPSLFNSASRISKKRSRPSRRAPTTVLATDASNFRAMVQVFTGIPSDPLSSSFFSPNLQTTDSLSPISSISSNYQTPINTQQIRSSLFQSIPPFASPEAFLTPERFGMVKGVDGFVSMAGSEEIEEGFGGEKGLESVRFACRGGRFSVASRSVKPSAPLSSSFFSPNLQTTDSLSLISSISPNYQTPINTQQIRSSLFQSIPPFASPEAFLTPERFGMVKGVEAGFVSMAGSEEVEEGFGGEKGLESVRFACRGGMFDSWICSSD